ncbi:unnamed protein product, partial [Staurois parvus]
LPFSLAQVYRLLPFSLAQVYRLLPFSLAQVYRLLPFSLAQMYLPLPFSLAQVYQLLPWTEMSSLMSLHTGSISQCALEAAASQIELHPISWLEDIQYHQALPSPSLTVPGPALFVNWISVISIMDSQGYLGG